MPVRPGTASRLELDLQQRESASGVLGREHDTDSSPAAGKDEQLGHGR
jgi:hypothetical protein